MEFGRIDTEGFLKTKLDNSGHRVVSKFTLMQDLKDSAVYDTVLSDIGSNNHQPSISRENYLDQTSVRSHNLVLTLMSICTVVLALMAIVMYIWNIRRRSKFNKNIEVVVKDKENHMTEINKLFRRPPKKINNLTKDRVLYRIEKQIEQNTQTQIVSLTNEVGIESNDLHLMKSNTKHSCTSLIIQLLKSQKNTKIKPFRRYSSFDYTSEFNPFRKLCDTYYYKINKNFKFLNAAQEVMYSIDEVIEDMTILFPKGKE